MNRNLYDWMCSVSATDWQIDNIGLVYVALAECGECSELEAKVMFLRAIDGVTA